MKVEWPLSYIMTGEYRQPKDGEWFISNGAPRRAKGELFCLAIILRPVDEGSDAERGA